MFPLLSLRQSVVLPLLLLAFLPVNVPARAQSLSRNAPASECSGVFLLYSMKGNSGIPSGVPYSEVIHPLDTLMVISSIPCTLNVYDGGGNNYVTMSVERMASFVAAGKPGMHKAVLLDRKGDILRSFTFRMEAFTKVTDWGKFGELFQLLYKGMCVYSSDGTESYHFRGKEYKVFVPWVLDNDQTNKGMRYFSPYGSDMIDLFSEVQREDGMIYSFVRNSERPGYYDLAYGSTNFIKRYDTVIFVRQPNENHVEYLFVDLLYQCWKATGNDRWMRSKLASAARALDYNVTDSLRWSKRFGLLKRPYTIDSWDFQVDDEYTPGDALTPTMCVVPGKTKFGIFYGDNTGYAQACEYLAEMFAHTGDQASAEKYRQRAHEIRERLNALAWNGHFFTHFIDEDPSVKRNLGVDEKSQISQSNAYSVNRGLPHEQNAAIIETYLHLKNHLPPGSPGEWYSIYPPFERGFGGHNEKWQYMNGGVAGHAAGELARGAFENGYESYGSDILLRLLDLGNKYGNGSRIWFSYTGAYPPPPPDPVYQPLDIRKVANMSIFDHAGKGALPWMNERKGNDMRNLPSGKQTFGGIEFDISDPSANEGKIVIGLSRQKGFKQQIFLPVGRKSGMIGLLHTLGQAGSEGIAGSVVFHYADGTSAAQYIINGKHITGWWFPELQGKLAGVAWRGPNGVSNDVGICWAGISNPFPEKDIREIEFRCSEDRGIWAIIAVSLADRMKYLPPPPQSYGGPDNWAAALGMAALVEGIAGITDLGTTFSHPRIAPRWTSARTDSAQVIIRYAASDGYVAYTFHHNPKTRTIRLSFTGSGEEASVHLLLPSGTETIRSVIAAGRNIPFFTSHVRNSTYADFSAPLKGVTDCEIVY